MQKLRWAIGVCGLWVCACAPAISNGADGIERLEQARSANPNSEPVVRSLGIAYFKANRYGDARAALAQAVAANPKDGVASLYLGLAAEAQNDLPAARTAYESYLAVGKTRGVKEQITARLAVIARRENEASARRAIAQERQLSTVAGPVTTIAVMPFTFAGRDTSLKPLERGFAELVTTDLSRVSALTVLDRGHLQALLDELKLQQTQGVQIGTGVRVGKLLQAGSIVGGSISQLPGDRLNATALVTNVRSSAPMGAGATDQQPLDQLFTLEKNLVLKLLVDNLKVVPTTAERNAIEQRPTRSLAAFLAYSRGLQEQDEGRFDDASRSFDNALRLDPGFVPAQRKSQETKNLVRGNAVTIQTVETGLRGTSEGGGQSVATGSIGSSAAAMADGLNPSVAGGATSGGTTSPTTPAADASSGTGADNPSTKTGRVTVIVRAPRP
jgi:tetratricopeptide (TPR) repeat protein